MLSSKIRSPDLSIESLLESPIKAGGEQVTIISKTLHYSLAAADIVSKEGISCHVLDIRTLLPLDKEAILRQRENR